MADRPGRRLSPEHVRGASLVETWPATSPTAPPSRPVANPLETYFDGVAEGPGVWKWRHYFDIYHRHLQRFVGRSPVVVEVGVYSGGSMPMWHAYFGAGTHVHGIDIEPACRGYASPTTTIHIGDQADPVFWQGFVREVPQVDVLIDDGGHDPEQQMATVEAILPHLRPGGVYICEDVTGTDNRFAAFTQQLAGGLHAYAPTSSPRGHVSPASPFQAAIHSLHVYPFVVVIEKRDHATTAFSAPKHGTQWQPYL
ncbi:MAG: class I SAM-dependent methyltransferase [Pirellulales bacterium]